MPPKLLRLAKSAVPVANMKLAAGLVYKGRIVAAATNSYRTHPMQQKYAENPHKIHLHAEVAAIIRGLKVLSPRELRKATMFVVRVNSRGESRYAKPCPGCQRCLRDYGIEKVKWTT